MFVEEMDIEEEEEEEGVEEEEKEGTLLAEPHFLGAATGGIIAFFGAFLSGAVEDQNTVIQGNEKRSYE